jgi:hypothetical protein
MRRFTVVSLVALGVLVIGLGSVALAMKEEPRPIQPPNYAVGRLSVSGPFVILQQGGDTTWVKPHADTTHCPGDPLHGHGGEAEGGPDGAHTWCFEDAQWSPVGGETANIPVTVPDSVGTNPPWDTRAWTTVDVRGLPSQTGVNFWHVDTYMGANGGELYTGNYCMWCGSDSLWQNSPVECNSWARGKKPGYGNQWNCVVQLDLTGFTTASACTMSFDPRYDTECKYDYFYVDYYNGTEWKQLAMFNGSSSSGLNVCGDPTKPNPDYFGFGNTGQPHTADWVPRGAKLRGFVKAIPAASIPDNPSFRWRVYTDGAWSDADGRGDTDGAAFFDNVRIVMDTGVYKEDFEGGPGGLGTEWSFPNPDGVLQAWHQAHDPDRPYEGNDGDVRTTCTLDSSIVYRARPKQGYASGQPWRNAWFYRLKAPKVAIPEGNGGTGCTIQYDQYMCALDYTCDYTNEHVRFHNTTYDSWCPWIDIDGYILFGGCFFWNFDDALDVTRFYGETADSMQISWCVLDVSSPGDFCVGKHKWTDNIIDNVSIGFYDGRATQFSARGIDLLQDSFHDSLCAFNSQFAPSTYESDSLEKYSVTLGNAPLPRGEQLYATISDKDYISEVRLYGSIDGGNTWIYNDMGQDTYTDPDYPDLGGEWYGTFCPSDFGFVHWPTGSTIWYYVWVEDQASNVAYWPNTADGGAEEDDFFSFSILPRLQPGNYAKILLVDGYGRRMYDYAECMAQVDSLLPIEDIYEQTLTDLGYCYDKYDISGAGSNAHVQPIEFADYYDCVIWFTGPYFSNYLFDKEAQIALQSYLAEGGKIVLAGDRIANNMAVVGEDSLNGEFLNGIMGCNYVEEMEGAFDKPYIYLEAAESVYVFGDAVPIPLDSLVLYRECPFLKDMSYVLASSSPDTGYTAQSLLYVDNYDPSIAPNGADGAIYVEKTTGGGQCVFVNFDFSALITHNASQCSGSHPNGDPTYQAGYYYGRTDLMSTILEDLFGLIPPGGSGIRDRGKPPVAEFKWALGQNIPNPVATRTEIKFEVASTSNVSIKVYNAMGQLVRTLKNERMQPGRYSVQWDGTNASGQKVSSGVYFYKMDANKFQATNKMLILK